MPVPYIPLNSRGDSPDTKPREMQRRRDLDTYKSHKITIYDIDYAIMSWLTRLGKGAVNSSGVVVDVPVMYANGERWSQIQEHSGIRDGNGKFMSPLMVIRRTAVNQDTRFDFFPIEQLSRRTRLIYTPTRNKNSQLEQFISLHNANRPKEFFTTQIPLFVKVTYQLYIWCDLQEQLNHIVEDIMHLSGAVWGETWQFTTVVNGVDFDGSIGENEDRLVQASVNIEVDGSLIDEFVLDENAVQRAFSIKRVLWSDETDAIF